MKYEDFTILFTSNSGGYKARVITSPGGEASGDFTPPFTSVTASRIIAAIQRDSHSTRDLRIALDREQPAAPSFDSLERLGAALFDSLFRGAVGNLFQRCLGLASERAEGGLRLKLRLDPSDDFVAALYSLPWELLYRTEVRSFLALSRTISVVRSLDVPQPARSTPFPSPLRVLVVLPNPRNVAPLNLDRETTIINAAFAEMHDLIEVTILTGATIHSLRSTLLKQPYHIVHFAGHGGRAEGRFGLFFEDASGAPCFVDAAYLADVLGTSTHVRLAVINACEGATIEESDVFTSVASSLVLRGIPAVVANQYIISDRAAIEFSEGFYLKIAGGESLDEAVQEGRFRIRAATVDAQEWHVPTLFTRLPENALFSSMPKRRQQGGSFRSHTPRGRPRSDVAMKQTAPGSERGDARGNRPKRRASSSELYRVTAGTPRIVISEKIRRLEAFQKLIRKWETLEGLTDGQEGKRVRDLRSSINREKVWVRQEVLSAGCLKTFTISPPPAVGGLIMNDVDAFAMLFETPYGMEFYAPIVDMVDETIGAMRSDSEERGIKSDGRPTSKETVRGLAFIAMPMAAGRPDFDDVHDAIKEAAKRCGIRAERVDEPHSTERITDRILESIRRAEYVIADLTEAKPNVYFEAGYAHALGKTPVYIAKDGTSLEFDLKDYPVIFFKGLRQLKDILAKRLRGIAAVKRPAG